MSPPAQYVTRQQAHAEHCIMYSTWVGMPLDATAVQRLQSTCTRILSDRQLSDHQIKNNPSSPPWCLRGAGPITGLGPAMRKLVSGGATCTSFVFFAPCSAPRRPIPCSGRSQP